MAHYRPFLDFPAWRANVVLQERTWAEYVDLFVAERDATSQEVVNEALGTTMRTAALESGAIEGLYRVERGITVSIAEQAAEWQHDLRALGASAPQHYADQLEALDHALDVATKRTPITEVWIRELHEVLCRHQYTVLARTPVGDQPIPLRKGSYKSSPNNVLLGDGSVHEYAPVSDVAAEMGRLVANLAAAEFNSSHPVVQCAYAHHAITSVHPFADGNGRIARALGSVYLLRAAGIPLVIFSDQRLAYFDALEAADSRSAQAFVTFVEDRALDTLSMVRDRLKDAKSSGTTQARRLQALLTSHGGLTHAEVIAAARRIVAALKPMFVDELDRLKSDYVLPDDVHTLADDMPSQACTYWDRPYHPVPTYGTGAKLKLWMQEPVHVQVETTPMVGIADDESERRTIIAIDANRPEVDPLFLRIDEVHPALTHAGREKFEMFIRRSVAAALAELARGVDQRLRAEGSAVRTRVPLSPDWRRPP